MQKSVLGLVLTIAAAVSPATAAEPWAPAAIVALDALELRAALAAGRVSAERVTAAYLERIEMLDDEGPALGAIIEANPDALAIARALDRRRAAGEGLGPLHGVPVLLKANIDTGDRLATSAGSRALGRHHASTDAEIASRLRAAGAVILGKTNLSEWANFRSSNSTSGWSSIGGQTRNPYVLDRNPCGSSSGSAVAVAAQLAPLAIGTETDGSIVCPAATNGVVGIKPTRGLVSTKGIVPIAESQDTVGPIARTVADAAMLLAVLAPGWTHASPNGDAAGVRGLRIGVLRDHFGAGTDKAVERNLSSVAEWLRLAGAELVDPMAISPGPEVRNAERIVLVAEFRGGLERYLGGVRHGPQSLAELIAFNALHDAEVMPYFGQDLLLAALSGPDTHSASYESATRVLREYDERVATLFDAERLDALLAPANARAWRTDWESGDRFTVGSSSLAAITGYPSIAVPTVLADELPLGVVVITRQYEERRLLAIATELERRRGVFPPPRFLPSARE